MLFSNQFVTLALVDALGEISLNWAMVVWLLQAGLSSPISKRVSERYMWGGTSRLSGAGLFLNTRPAMSNVEPGKGHRKPPCQSSGSEGWAPGWNLSEGEHPRCEPMTIPTKISGLMERASLRAYAGVSSCGLGLGWGAAHLAS